MEYWDQTIAWTVAIVVFVILKPFWIKKRRHFIFTGILFFSPTPIYYSNITGHVSLWPLLGALPAYVTSWALLDMWLYYLLPSVIITGLVLWAIAIWRKI
ncbi:hypothetical protein N9X74_00405 [Porticoccaceae bacterium]|nr:hypothetical protein [Porticoccaceae bacterium]